MLATSSTRGTSVAMVAGSVRGSPMSGAMGSPSSPSHRLSQEDLQAISKTKWLEVIIHFLSGFRNDTADFSRPQLRPAVESTYVAFVAMYAAIVVAGCALNALVLVRLGDLYRRNTHRLLANICAANIFQCVLVIPLSLVVLLVQNWIFGPVMCYVLPMMQDVALHVVMLTFSAIGYERYRFHANPSHAGASSYVVSCCLWIVSCLIVLPYPVYTTYLDLGSLMRDQFHGVGICILNLAEDMQTYTRVAFCCVYVMPIALSVFFHVRVHLLLRRQAANGTSAVRMYEARDRAASLPAGLDPRFPDNGQFYSMGPLAAVPARDHGSLQLEAEEDLERERRTQRFLIGMNVAFGLCLLPLMVLRIVKHSVQETYENTGHFDIMFCLFVWVAFLPSVICPVLIAVWIMSVPRWKERVQICFSFSNGKLPRSCGGRHARHTRHSLQPPPRAPTSPLQGLTRPRTSGAGAAAGAHAAHASPDIVPGNGQILSVTV